MAIKIYEKQLEQIIYDTPMDILWDKGFEHPSTKLYRQVPLGNYGIADLIGASLTMDLDPDRYGKKVLEINIYELKQHQVNMATLLQAVRYAKGVERYIYGFRKKKISAKCNIILIGKSIAMDEFAYMPEAFNNLFIYTYTMDVNGFQFSQQRKYKLIDEGFE